MAWNNCIGKYNLRASFDCSVQKPLPSGYTGRGILYPVAFGYGSYKIGNGCLAPVPNIFNNPDGFRFGSFNQPDFSAKPQQKLIAINNMDVINPFNGTTYAGTTENGRNQVKKTFTFRVSFKGRPNGWVTQQLFNNFGGLGFVAILERNNNDPVAKYEVIGGEKPLMCSADGFSRDEYMNGGDITFTATTVESGIDYYYAQNVDDISETITTFNHIIETWTY